MTRGGRCYTPSQPPSQKSPTFTYLPSRNVYSVGETKVMKPEQTNVSCLVYATPSLPEPRSKANCQPTGITRTQSGIFFFHTNPPRGNWEDTRRGRGKTVSTKGAVAAVAVPLCAARCRRCIADVPSCSVYSPFEQPLGSVPACVSSKFVWCLPVPVPRRAAEGGW